MVALTATDTYGDGSTQNLTNQVQWSSLSPQAVVDARENVTGVSPSMATIKATLTGRFGVRSSRK
ncbi:MAG: hypothetical protein LC793_00385 [Thermomicrobia bacterium]|nr:hypothetical protein [Thermomicrobia bacterium]